MKYVKKSKMLADCHTYTPHIDTSSSVASPALAFLRSKQWHCSKFHSKVESIERADNTVASSAERILNNSRAARLSKGSLAKLVPSRELVIPERTLRRHPSQRITVTVVLFNTITSGVPSESEILAAIDEMEAMYSTCNTSGNRHESKFDWYNTESTSQQREVMQHDIFPSNTLNPTSPPTILLPEDGPIAESKADECKESDTVIWTLSTCVGTHTTICWQNRFSIAI